VYGKLIVERIVGIFEDFFITAMAVALSKPDGDCSVFREINEAYWPGRLVPAHPA
jgi:hypothetical protein